MAGQHGLAGKKVCTRADVGENLRLEIGRAVKDPIVKRSAP